MQVSLNIEGVDEARLAELAKASGASIEETALSIVAAVLDDDARAHTPDKMHMQKSSGARPARQAERMEELEEEVRQLREQLAPTVTFPAEIGLSPIQTKILSFILARAPNVARKERIHFAVYPDPDARPDWKTIDVMMVKIRRALARYGVTIGTVHSEGFILADSDAAVLRGWLAGVAPVAVEEPAQAPRPVRRPKAPAAVAAPEPPPAPVAPPAPDVSKAQIKAIKAFASVGNDAKWIARQVDLPVALIKSVLKRK